MKLFEAMSSLSSIERYSQSFLTKQENVLEHSGFVTLFSYFIGVELISKGVELNMELLLTKSIIHDIDEIITGDVPRPTKYFNPDSIKIFKEMERSGVQLFLKDLINDNDILIKTIYSKWKHAKDDAEGEIVKLADLAAVAYKAWEEYIILGNSRLIGHLYSVRENIKSVDFSIVLFDIQNNLIDLINNIIDHHSARTK